MTKNHIAKFFVLFLYIGCSLFLSIFIMLLLFTFIGCELNATWEAWGHIIQYNALLSAKLSLISVPITIILWLSYWKEL